MNAMSIDDNEEKLCQKAYELLLKAVEKDKTTKQYI